MIRSPRQSAHRPCQPHNPNLDDSSIDRRLNVTTQLPNPPPTTHTQAPNTTGCDIGHDRCGFRLDHNVSIYSSWDLSSGSWHFHGHAFPYTDRTPGTLFRPTAVFNPNTKKYVLWWNYVHPNMTYAGTLVI